jgi:hypothetical protein
MKSSNALLLLVSYQSFFGIAGAPGVVVSVSPGHLMITGAMYGILQKNWWYYCPNNSALSLLAVLQEGCCA